MENISDITFKRVNMMEDALKSRLEIVIEMIGFMKVSSFLGTSLNVEVMA